MSNKSPTLSCEKAYIYTIDEFEHGNGASPGIRPVINIRSDTVLSGSGTSTDPFKVVGA